MITLTTTRFNTKTWKELQSWLAVNKWSGCVYGSPMRVKSGVNQTMIVLEMHNDENEIKAISLLHNRAILTDKAHQIYKDRNYNRFIYKGPYRLVLADIQETLTPFEKKIIAILNRLLFKGSCHLKRAQGITAMPPWIMNNKYIDFIKYLKAMFMRYYKDKRVEGAGAVAEAGAGAVAEAGAAVASGAVAPSFSASIDNFNMVRELNFSDSIPYSKICGTI